MSGRILLGVIAAATGTLVALTCFLSVLFGGASASCTLPPAAISLPASSAGAAAAGFDAEQTANAAAIVQTGSALGVPVRGWIIAVAVAIQESSLRNLTHGDAAGPDSRGLFQQRAAWGPETERMDPAKAAQMFYLGGAVGQDGLLEITGWQNMPLTRAAQAVQHSGHPGAYAAHEDDATRLVAEISSPDTQTPPSDSPSGSVPRALSPARTADPGATGLPASSPQGGSASPAPPVAAACTEPRGPGPAQALAYARSQIGVPYQWGGDGEAAGDLGFDCSGLTKAAYEQAGIGLPRTAQTQFNAGPLLPADAVLQPGDLVFFGTGPRHVTHVGIYAGENQMIDAPHRGATVREEPVWKGRVGATRPAAEATQGAGPLEAA